MYVVNLYMIIRVEIQLQIHNLSSTTEWYLRSLSRLILTLALTRADVATQTLVLAVDEEEELRFL